jgi:hypothetical protein
MALAYLSIGDFFSESDGFCHKCPNHDSLFFQNDGKALEYVRRAVVAQLKRDGYTIADGFDPETGDEICR